METESDTLHLIRNRACIVCGAAFSFPRAGKLYCSAKCKQFHYYHKQEIMELKQAKRGISNENQELSLKEYNSYSLSVKRSNQYQTLKNRLNSTYFTLSTPQEVLLQELANELPMYIKQFPAPTLSLEEWSFVKLLYPHLKKEDFGKLLNNLGSRFFSRLTDNDNDIRSTSKSDPIKNLYKNHLFKIAVGKIKFV